MNLQSKVNPKALFQIVIEFLRGRGGFDDWWSNIDSETQKEIEYDFVKTMEIVYDKQ